LLLEETVTAKVKFMRLRVPFLKNVEIDLTDSSEKKLDGDCAGALVRPVIRYREKDEGEADATWKKLKEGLSGAKHVFNPVRQIVKSGRVKGRAVARFSDPERAFLSWLQNREKEVKELGRENVEACFREIVQARKVTSNPLFASQIQVKSVIIEDYIPFRGSQVIEDLSPGVYGIVGEYDDNDRRSNRAGKSAFLKAILTAIFGEDRSEIGKGDSFDRDIHSGRDSYVVGVKLLVGNEKRDLEVERRRERGKSPVVFLDGDRGKKTDAEELVRGLLGFSREDFVKVAFVRPGDLHGIVTSGNSALKADLMRWMGLDFWASYHVEVSSRLARLEDERRDIDIRLDYVGTEVSGLKNQPSQEKIDLFRKELEEKEKELVEAIVALERVRSGSKRRELESTYLRLVKERESANVVFTYLDETYDPEELVHLLADDILSLEEEVEQYKKKMYRREADEDRLGVDLVKVGASEKCPLDGERCPRHQEFAARTKKWKEELVERTKKKAVISERVEKMERELDDMRSIRRKAEVKASLLREKEESLKRVGDELQTMKAGPSNEAEECMAVKRVEGIRERLKEKDRISFMEREIERKKELDAEILRLKTRMDENLKISSVLRFIQQAVSRDGIPASQLEEAVLAIESGANQVLSILRAPHRVRFIFQKDTQKKEDVCSGCGRVYRGKEKMCPECGSSRSNKKAEELSLSIVDAGGRTQEFSQDSSGGRDLAALSLRVAMAKYFGFNVLFLDEVCGSLDEENLDMLVGLLEKMPALGFDQVFVISHRQSMQRMLEKLIVIERNSSEGFSKVFLR
jgi:DNA repair exonuclease SbcCD ATPase subunit